jgi:hypothetical protein
VAELPRLKWTKCRERGFRAYPAGHSHGVGRCAWIFLQLNTLDTSTKEFRRSESWHWSVQWDGWFAASGSATGKQDAADRATAAWWEHIAEPLPRNVELEVDMIIARVLVMPPPNSVFQEDMAFLQRLNRSLFSLYEQEIKAERAPELVRDLLANLSTELYRRREAGEREEERGVGWGVT